MGLFKNIVRAVRKPVAALLGANIMTALPVAIKPSLVGLKSASSVSLARTIVGGLAVAGGAALGTSWLQKGATPANPSQTYEQWLAALAVRTQPQGVSNGAAIVSTSDRAASGVPVSYAGGRQGRRTVRRGRRRCWVSHGRRYCYR